MAEPIEIETVIEGTDPPVTLTWAAEMEWCAADLGRPGGGWYVADGPRFRRGWVGCLPLHDEPDAILVLSLRDWRTVAARIAEGRARLAESAAAAVALAVDRADDWGTPEDLAAAARCDARADEEWLG